MVRSTLGWSFILIVLATSAACSGTREPFVPSSETCAAADLTIDHLATGAWGRKDRVVVFEPGVPEVTFSSGGEGVFCIAFEPTTPGLGAAILSNFSEISGRQVTASPEELTLIAGSIARVLKLEVAGTGDAVVKYDLRLYRGKRTDRNPALLIDPVLMIKN